MPIASVRLFLCGDVMTGRGVDQILPHPSDPELREDYVHDARDYVTLAEEANGPVPRGVDPAYSWGDVLAALDDIRPDARIANLETSVTTSDDFWPEKGINYRMSPANAACLAALRLDACALANNHLLDFGRSGLAETLAVLHAVGLRTAGAGLTRAEAQRPAEVPLPDGRRLLVLSVGTGSSGIPPEWAASEDASGVDLLPDLSDETADAIAARAQADAREGDMRLVSIHWGGNWGYDVPHAHQRFAHRLVDGGIDVVHGHSSHHPRPFEVYRGRLVLYGCGDFLNDYEGIRGYASYRGDLVLAYLPTLAGDGRLEALRLLPFQLHRLRLRRASAGDARWLGETLTKASAAFGTGVEVAAEGALAWRGA